MKRKISSGIISLLMLPIHFVTRFYSIISYLLLVDNFTFALLRFLAFSFFLLLRVCLMKCNLMMDQSQIDGFKSPWECGREKKIEERKFSVYVDGKKKEK